MKIKLKDIFNIPNVLCYIRLALIPVFIFTYIHSSDPKDYYFSALIILISGITDFADGFIARKYHMITELGKLIDPVADKLTQAAVVLVLMFQFKGMVILTIILLIKELFMFFCGLMLLKRNKKLDGAKWFGKVSTAVFYSIMFVLIAVPTLPLMVIDFFMVVIGFFLILSFILYASLFIKMFSESKAS
ncbi:phosphatidylglycerophosphate synthase [Clostridium pasteurianum DSM 525 = ATCC 6013]|uniref:Phosphatidylglycerophosphate synthase n=1 Tax=Clostridium pasteurianum DSM 525 = ATCC 6013 TaxID=1262449 RepID=A0A0H3J3P1_CLOPA|nr:CDP-alcohol phosphatidyltransferase family protein [Clostridium pasteurianum]AJA47452.1 phosphatidylglycerophosphate synthase [Clostridium pasteurianum DSM 525 = ATCC 6013]AJA51440.1 phosphatidylglycerophosphate synthase [Clostridium pasteurianum DSM 525 = ATCC 6013]AOZ74777.1 CDP-diacylglycerol--glycerol-3-phosphate 3-phosphatidyltransferase [Clostridium pasteurianum DSM 525 = ATCC 6013]AOZ78573.1 CDP-diacylglycerol--glycerol-3-phosphate 3-phosphatidyltransferase [Clostridium pasteurianum]